MEHAFGYVVDGVRYMSVNDDGTDLTDAWGNDVSLVGDDNPDWIDVYDNVVAWCRGRL